VRAWTTAQAREKMIISILSKIISLF
jgi:hypothetical protein